jgi:hypothetical protein
LGGPKLAPAIRPAKVVPVSMADDESAEPLLEGSVMSRERPTSASAARGAAAERRGSGMAERESKVVAEIHKVDNIDPHVIAVPMGSRLVGKVPTL